jgi:exodeoxyribonuclease-3
MPGAWHWSGRANLQRVRIATWNVNSLRSRVDRVEAFLERHDVDVLAMQETKAREDQLPLMGLQAAGYEVAVAGLNQWNGVAIASRVGLEGVQVGFDGMPGYGEPVAAESRAIGAVCGGVRVWSLYVPNGRKPDDPHYVYKLDWLARLRAEATRWLDTDTVLMGDWNICPTDDDVFDPAQFRKSTHVTPPEREAFQAFLDSGWAEVTRAHAPGYTYWDYYRQRFERDRGLKIDFALASPSLAARVTGAFIDRDERDPAQGQGSPSDHAPVVVDLA